MMYVMASSKKQHNVPHISLAIDFVWIDRKHQITYNTVAPLTVVVVVCLDLPKTQNVCWIWDVLKPKEYDLNLNNDWF